MRYNSLKPIIMKIKLCFKTMGLLVILWICAFQNGMAQVSYQPDFLSVGTPFGIQDNLNLTMNGMSGLNVNYHGKGVNGVLHNFTVNLDGQYPAVFSTADSEKIYFRTPDYQYQNIYCHYIYVCSDSCLKTNIRELPPMLGRVNKLRLIKDDSSAARAAGSAYKARLYGNDMLQQFPEITQKDDEDQSISVNYMSMIPVLLESVKELRQLVEQQEHTITELTNLIHD